MTERDKHINLLFTAELQFRFASAVRLATRLKNQPLDLPKVWIHGRHRVDYQEIALREDQADYASFFMHRSATYLLAVAIKDAIRAVVIDPKASDDPNVRAAYQIARLIRNSFAHALFSPSWSIDEDCRDQTFEITDVISLDTHGLQGKEFDWRHYGGPLALFRLCRFVRYSILNDEVRPRVPVPEPKRIIQQQGELIVVEIEELSPSAVPIEIERLSDGGIPLGGGHILYPQKDDEES
ncbi:MAG: hypothetical protein AB1453_05905 [Chloroflexota bacterium]